MKLLFAALLAAVSISSQAAEDPVKKLLRLSTTHKLAGQEGNKVQYWVSARNLEISSGGLKAKLCEIAMTQGGLGQGDRSPRRVTIRDEQFTEPVANQPRRRLDRTTKMIKQHLMTARVNNGGTYIFKDRFPYPKNAPTMYSGDELLNSRAYDDLTAFTADVYLGMNAFRVKAVKEPVVDLSKKKGSQIKEQWSFEAEPLPPTDAHLQIAQPGDDNVIPLTETQFLSLPFETRKEMLKYDFWREYSEMPHSIYGSSQFGNGNNTLDIEGGTVFKVLKNSEVVGYILQIVTKSYSEVEYSGMGSESWDFTNLITVRYNAKGQRVDLGPSGKNLETENSFQDYGYENLHRQRRRDLDF